MAAPSFRVKIALLSTVLSGAVLLAFGIFFLTVIHRVGLARVDREILALGESQLKMRPDRDAGAELERSLNFIYGPDAGERLILWSRDRSGDTIYRSPNWPTGLDESRLPAPAMRHPPPDLGRRPPRPPREGPHPRPEPPPEGRPGGPPPPFGPPPLGEPGQPPPIRTDRKSTRLNSSHVESSYAV